MPLCLTMLIGYSQGCKLFLQIKSCTGRRLMSAIPMYIPHVSSHGCKRAHNPLRKSYRGVGVRMIELLVSAIERQQLNHGGKSPNSIASVITKFAVASTPSTMHPPPMSTQQASPQPENSPHQPSPPARPANRIQQVLSGTTLRINSGTSKAPA